MRDSRAPRGGGAADAFVLTALQVEFQAVLEQLGPAQEFTVDRDGAQYVEGVLEGLHGRVRVAVHLAGQGNEVAAAAVQRAVQRYEPAVVLLVGVAGGRKDVALGDVVAADAVHGYEGGRDEGEGLRPRTRTWHSDFALVQQAQMVASLHNWRRRIPGWDGGEQPPGAEGQPRAFVGALAAGAKVIADERSQTALLVARTAGDALAVEMEGLGFLIGVRPNAEVGALVVRGISDLLSGKSAEHDGRWQPLAARHAAAFAFEVLARHLPAVRPEEARRHLEAARNPALPPPGTPGALVATANGAAPVPAPAGEPVHVPAQQAHPQIPAGAQAPVPRAAARAGLALPELAELAGLLARVPALNSPDGWQLLFDSVPVLGRSTPRVRAVGDQAVALLQTCAATGAWGELAEAVGVLWPDALAAREAAVRLAARA